MSTNEKALKAALHAILDEATSGEALPRQSLLRIQKLAAAALVPTFDAQLVLVPSTHKVVPLEPSEEQLKAVLGESPSPEDTLMVRRDYALLVQSAPDSKEEGNA